MSIYCLQGCGILLILAMACAGYAYRVNAKRSTDDPKKKIFHPAAIFLAPFTFPVFILAWITLFVIRALFYGIFLVIFTVGLVVIRKPFLLIWLDKVATKVGNILLEANMLLVRLFLPHVNEKT